MARSLRLLFAGTVAIGGSAQAQEAVQKVVVTGSSIKRIAAEGALPVQTVTRAQIDQLGVTNVADLVAALPSMQGFTTASASINGGGGGLQTASIHAIGEGYTLVLLNGRRLAPATSGSTVNLASIPLAAIERVEVLTDGANTLYGSDAIAGVINFILKKNQTDLTISANYGAPQHAGGGRSANVGISKGWGDLDKDGYNLMFSAAHDQQKELLVSQREFSKSGVIPFTQDGKRYSFYQLSGNSMPGIATVKYTDATGVANAARFSPNFLATGKCNGPNLYQIDNTCRFDYTGAVEALPGLKRDSATASLNLKLNADTTLFAEALASKFTNRAQYAPPANGFGIALNSPLFAKSIAPYLARLGIAPNSVINATMNLRLSDAGGRTDDWRTDARHLVVGIEGAVRGWDYSASYTHSTAKATDSADGGYVDLNKFQGLVDNGTFDPFAPPGSSKAILAPVVLHKQVSSTDSSIDAFSVHGSTEVFRMPTGAAQLGIGADTTRQSYVYKLDNDFFPGGHPVDANRRNWGSYAELLVPLLKDLDLTASTRYDNYTAVNNGQTFDSAGKAAGPATQGNAASKATYKLALRYRAADSVLLRGSYGTGFKVADMTTIVNPLQDGGASQFHACPITNKSDPRYVMCYPGSTEYTILSGGNPFTGAAGLKPEESKQATLGLRFEPMTNVSLGLDWWSVRLRNQIQTLSEDMVFGNPALYDGLFRAYYSPAQKQDVLAAALTPFNLARSRYEGLDWDHTFKWPTPVGKLNVNWTGTYMLKSEQEVPGGTPEQNIGRFNSYANATFRVITRVSAALAVSPSWTHSLSLNYRSGYTDQEYTSADSSPVITIKADGSAGDFVPIRRTVSSYTTTDWQTRFTWNRELVLTAGVRNLFDIAPPFSIRNAGGGNQSGYDGRYADPLGRQFYLNGSYKF
ncbi:MAG: TonB-dependent receptor [Pseudomonadota bacterium]